jgi:polyamine oxidase
MATVVYHESQRLEQMSTKAVQKEVTRVLKRMFGPEATAPVEILVPVWKNNPLFGSSYSNWGLGMSEAHHRNLRKRLGRLWFAGEAMSRKYFGFLHGAWMDGLEVGSSVAKCLKTSCEKETGDNSGEEVSGCEPDATSRFVYQGMNLHRR